MLTAHTVLLSVAVTLISVASNAVPWQFRFVGYAAIVCTILILLCFAASKNQYEDIGVCLSHPEQEKSDSDLLQDIKRASIRWRLTKISEAASIVGLFMEVSLLGWVLTTY